MTPAPSGAFSLTLLNYYHVQGLTSSLQYATAHAMPEPHSLAIPAAYYHAKIPWDYYLVDITASYPL